MEVREEGRGGGQSGEAKLNSFYTTHVPSNRLNKCHLNNLNPTNHRHLCGSASPPSGLERALPAPLPPQTHPPPIHSDLLLLARSHLQWPQPLVLRETVRLDGGVVDTPLSSLCQLGSAQVRSINSIQLNSAQLSSHLLGLARRKVTEHSSNQVVV